MLCSASVASAAVQQRGSTGSSTLLLLRQLLCIAALFMALILSPLGMGAARAQLTNGGFENGGHTGWSGSASVTNAFSSYTPVEGNFFAVLEAGEADVYTTLSQSFTATAGQTISGYAFFSTQEGNDDGSVNDDGYVVIRDATGAVVASVFRADAFTLGEGNHPWTFWSYTVPADGTYTVEAGVANRYDNRYPSFIGLDGVSPTTATPNTAPVAVDDSAKAVRKGLLTSVTIHVIGNDYDPDGNPFTVSAVTDGSKGTVVDNGDGTLTYTRDAKARGTLADSFTYTISDDFGGTATATVTITAK